MPAGNANKVRTRCKVAAAKISHNKHFHIFLGGPEKEKVMESIGEQ